ncbi:hypothetical protein DLM_4068 [Aquitalea magnusonii]|uniref:Uncharacterized protein n=1 Tax=Aquitalea magnusonii TaxID=332411 RepID=A0A3G9GQ00_9NEIS|nr:hypothetical protein DLM_4068 [Aquitalea magnusonii]
MPPATAIRAGLHLLQATAQCSSTVLRAYPSAADKIAQRPWGKTRQCRQHTGYGKAAQRSSRVL